MTPLRPRSRNASRSLARQLRGWRRAVCGEGPFDMEAMKEVMSTIPFISRMVDDWRDEPTIVFRASNIAKRLPRELARFEQDAASLGLMDEMRSVTADLGRVMDNVLNERFPNSPYQVEAVIEAMRRLMVALPLAERSCGLRVRESGAG